MDNDLVIYNKKTREIIAILTNIDRFDDIVLNKQYEYARVNCNEPYIKIGKSKIYYAKEGKIINFKDYKIKM